MATFSGRHPHDHSVTDPKHTHTENTAASYTQNATTASAATGISIGKTRP